MNFIMLFSSISILRIYFFASVTIASSFCPSLAGSFLLFLTKPTPLCFHTFYVYIKEIPLSLLSPTYSFSSVFILHNHIVDNIHIPFIWDKRWNISVSDSGLFYLIWRAPVLHAYFHNLFHVLWDCPWCVVTRFLLEHWTIHRVP